MTTAATIASRLILDTKDFNDKLQDAENKAGNFESKMKAIGGAMTKAGGLLTAGLTVPIVGFGVKAIDAASDLSESMNKVNVVFATSGGEINAWAENASTALGMSSQQALEAAGTYGNLFQALGATEADAATMSKGLVELSADLASFNNANPEDVLLALRSGLSGEAEPMKRFGVALTAAAVEAKALEMGLYDANGELSEAGKMAARYQIIMDQTKLAQGDFARTSEGLANSQRIVKAQFTEIAASLGTQLLPYIEKGVAWLKQLADRFVALNPEQQKTILIIGLIVAAIGPLLMIIGTLITSVGAIAGVFAGISAPVLLVVAAIIAVIALLAIAWKNDWGGIQEKTKAVVEWIKVNVSAFLAAIQGWWAAHGAQVKAIVQGLWNGIVAVFNWFKGIFTGIFSAWKSAFEGDWTAFGTKMRAVWDEVWNTIITILSTAWDTIKTVVGNLIKDMIEKFKNTNWKEVGSNIIKGIASGISGAVSWIVDAAKKAAKAAYDAAVAFFKIGSPSKLMEVKIGANIPKGVAKGIDKNAQIPINSMLNLSKGISSGISGNDISLDRSNKKSVSIQNLNVYTNSGIDAIPYSIERALAVTA